MKLCQSLAIIVALQTLVFGSVFAPYPKYYISNYCGPHKGSTIELGPTGGRPSVALLKLKRETYKPNLECNVTVKAPQNYGIIAYVKRIKLRKYYSYEDSLEVMSDNNMTSLKWFGNNEELTPKVSLISSANNGELYFIFKSHTLIQTLFSKGFKIVLTAFTLSNNGICGKNSSLAFNCNNRLCVDSSLECDGYNNCINHFDEHNCSEGSETIIGPIVFGVTLLVMAILVIIFMSKTDKQKRREMARRFSKACISGGRRLSTIFALDRRVSPPQGVMNRSVDEHNIYRSVPIIYESDKKPEKKSEKTKEISFEKDSDKSSEKMSSDGK